MDWKIVEYRINYGALDGAGCWWDEWRGLSLPAQAMCLQSPSAGGLRVQGSSEEKTQSNQVSKDFSFIQALANRCGFSQNLLCWIHNQPSIQPLSTISPPAPSSPSPSESLSTLESILSLPLRQSFCYYQRPLPEMGSSYHQVRSHRKGGMGVTKGDLIYALAYKHIYKCIGLFIHIFLL